MVVRWLYRLGAENAGSLLASEDWRDRGLPHLHSMAQRCLQVGDGAVARGTLRFLEDMQQRRALTHRG